MNDPRHHRLVVVRADVFAVLERIRLDSSYKTYDSIVREMLRKTHPHEASDL